MAIKSNKSNLTKTYIKIWMKKSKILMKKYQNSWWQLKRIPWNKILKNEII